MLFQAWLGNGSYVWSDQGLSVSVIKYNRSAPWEKAATGQAGNSGLDVPVVHSPPVTPSSSSLLVYCQHQRKITPWIMWEHKLKAEAQEQPSTCVTLSAVVWKELVSQVSSWSEVHRFMLEEGKQRQSPGPTFLGCLCYKSGYTPPIPKFLLEHEYNFHQKRGQIHCYAWVRHKYLLFDHQLL